MDPEYKAWAFLLSQDYLRWSPPGWSKAEVH